MKAACMRFRSKLAGLFSGSHTYSTTQMQDWRVRKRTERAYGHNRVLSSSMFLFHVVEREVYLRKVSTDTWEFYMTLRNVLRTIDLARAAGISVQQVRNYEALGLLPQVSRGKSGYRLYTQHHLAALKTARSLVGGYGWQRMPAIMHALHRAALSAALAPIDSCHAGPPTKRLQVEQPLPPGRALPTGSRL